MTPSEALIATRKLIETPDKWLQEALASDVNGIPVHTHNPQAAKFCVFGALIRVNERNASELRGYDELSAALPIDEPLLGKFNDAHTHEEVLALIDKAISKIPH